MKRYTVYNVMAANPCDEYSEGRVTSLWAGREALTSGEIAGLEIPIEDRIWVLIRVCMDARTQRIFACDCAERALMRESEAGREPDAWSWNAIAVSRRFAYGSATSEELDAAYSAASAAVWDAASAAAWDAASAAARDAASAAARDAACAAAWDAACAAARDAACAAARDAACAAACDAASAASRDAARDAERAWQLAHAIEMIEAQP